MAIDIRSTMSLNKRNTMNLMSLDVKVSHLYVGSVVGWRFKHCKFVKQR